MRQTCKRCGREDKFDFWVPDDVWAAAVPHRFRERVLCLACFDDFAYENRIDYAAHLSRLYFAGDQATFEFNVMTGSSPRRALPDTRCTVRHSVSKNWCHSRWWAILSSCGRSAKYRFRADDGIDLPYQHPFSEELTNTFSWVIGFLLRSLRRLFR